MAEPRLESMVFVGQAYELTEFSIYLIAPRKVTVYLIVILDDEALAVSRSFYSMATKCERAACSYSPTLSCIFLHGVRLPDHRFLGCFFVFNRPKFLW